jgi:hypothetical protein
MSTFGALCLLRLPWLFDQGEVNGVFDAQFMRLFKRFVLFEFFSQKGKAGFIINSTCVEGRSNLLSPLIQHPAHKPIV